VFAPQAGSYYSGDVLTGIDETCAQHGLQVVAVQTAFGWQASMLTDSPIGDLYRIGRAQRLGVITITATTHPDELAIQAQIREPIVAIAGPHPRPGGPSIVTDNAGGAAQAVRHLLAHGHRRIGFVGAFSQDDMAGRLLGYKAALKEAGIKFDPALVFKVQYELTPGREAVRAILGGGIPPSAVFAATDRQALDLLAGFAEAGVLVPDDIAVIGFDDSEAAQTAVPALTSVRQLPSRLGSAAVNLLLDAVDGAPGTDGAHLLPTSLVERHSCGCFETEQGFVRADHDWTAPDWQEHLSSALEEALEASAGFSSGDVSGEMWPGVSTVIKAFDLAVRGLPVPNVTALDEAWRSACARTRNADTLLGLVDLLEFVGLCRQPRASDDPALIRPKLKGFLAQARLQILRYCSIADPFHTATSELQLELTRAFLDPDLRPEENLDWLRMANATHGCLARWEDDEDGRALRITACYGKAKAKALLGTRMAPEDFPPADWFGDVDMDGPAGTVTIVPIGTPGRAWGVLAAILPRERRYFDDYWALQHGTSLMALVLDRNSSS
jgi:DNA-binding LacI/PurR family transcriptional regulator